MIRISTLTLSFLLISTLNSCSNDGDNEVTVEEVARRNIVEMVSANGKIQPEVDVKITPEVSGKITSIHVREGDAVKKGDLLITLNPDLLKANLSRATASLNTARANLSNAKARKAQVEAQFINSEKVYQRTLQLFKDGVISQAEMDQAESAYQTALAERTASVESVNASEYSVMSSRATRTEASDNLGRTSIFAPNDGIITALQVEEGETVLGTIQMSGTEIMRVSDLNVMEVDVEVNESDIVRVSMGDTADVEVDAYVDKIFKGIVTEIANAASNTSGLSTDQVTNFSVKIRILPESYQDILEKNKDAISPFRTGMSATVEIRTDRKNDVLSIPIEAVTTRTDTTSADSFKEKMKRRKEALDKSSDLEPIECVFLHRKGEAKIRPVKVGIQDNRYIEIIEGVEEGDEVIVGPYAIVSRELEEGSDVSIKEEEDEEE